MSDGVTMKNGLDTEKIRRDFPILLTTSNDKKLVYLDSAATSQKPHSVINAISNYYRKYNANIHRGLYDISVKATEEYTESKWTVANFINARSYREIIYCKNTTDAINLVALSWGEKNLKKDDTILITEMEHHSNIVPWQLLAKRKGAKLEYTKIGSDFTLDMEDFKRKLNHKPKLVSFTHVSNVLGTVNDVKKMTSLAHKKGATVLIDGAQAVPHMSVDMKDIGADFYAFSGHKMLGPAGIGVLYGSESLLDEMPPVIGGGDMIRSVKFQESTWNELPWKFEAGTSNTESGIGLGEAVNYLNRIGMNRIRQHELSLTKYALKRLEETNGIKIYGIGSKEMTEDNRAGVISFNIQGAHPHDVAAIFNSEGIAIRAGHHCAMPLVNDVLNEPAVARMSFYIYNTEDEIEKAVQAVEKVRKVLRLKV